MVGKRIDYIDYLKGLSIIWVVWYHTVHPWFVDFSFRMPLFFLASGIFLGCIHKDICPKEDQPIDWVCWYEKDGMEGLRKKGIRDTKPLMTAADTPAVRETVTHYRESIKTAKSEWQKESKREVSDATFRRFLDLLAQDMSV